jgi:hypothetical protein
LVIITGFLSGVVFCVHYLEWGKMQWVSELCILYHLTVVLHDLFLRKSIIFYLSSTEQDRKIKEMKKKRRKE